LNPLAFVRKWSRSSGKDQYCINDDRHHSTKLCSKCPCCRDSPKPLEFDSGST
jgi:hypothetical protein